MENRGSSSPDIHSNLAALEGVLDDAGAFDAAICARDIVSYGPDPAECVDVLRGLSAKAVSGNHDMGVAAGEQLPPTSNSMQLRPSG